MKKQTSSRLVCLATDICVFRQTGSAILILLIRRAKPPFEGCWALPGGRLEADETLDQCANRELFEETGLRAITLMHFANFSEPLRDPRERTVSAAYIARVASDAEFTAGSDASTAQWFPITALPSLAFDHDHILKRALTVLQPSKDAINLSERSGYPGDTKP